MIFNLFRFLSTLSLRRATLNLPSSPIDKNISIHALLAESDLRHCTTYLNCSLFLSTLSLRRATPGSTTLTFPGFDFYPRSPCGERPKMLAISVFIHTFLSTLSLRRATAKLYYLACPFLSFLSTLSLRRATHYGWSWYDDFTISIHALLAESDVVAIHYTDGALNFYPRSPCGERPPSNFASLR